MENRQKDKAVTQVFKTKNYSKFKFLSGNRPLKSSHLKRLMASFEIKDLEIPIIVNEEFEIIDGQHRFEVQKKLGYPIVYILKKGYQLPEVHILNTSRRNWTMKDFMDSYADLGMKEYVKYREFWKKYRFGHKETLQMLLGYNGQPGDGAVATFRDGEFKVNNLEKAEENAEKIVMVKEFYFGYKRRFFVNAMLRLFGHSDYDHVEFLLKLRYLRDRLYDATSTNRYLRLIEEIYNYRRQGKKIPLYLDLRVVGTGTASIS